MNNTEAHAPALPAGYRIRALGPQDALALEWEGEYSHYRRLYALALSRAAAGQAQLWGAVDAHDALVGQVFVLLYAENDLVSADGHSCAFIHSFRVRPQHRNGGLGTGLMQHAEADLRQRGFGFVTLNVADDNPAAMRLYRRLGYQPLQPISGYWSFVDHEGVQRYRHEPGWRMGKQLVSG
ncbi:MAG: GNAT family N-acetyltransferase [Anaerolineales bacterium]|nr:GNAT family N-acetyltransferase [Anaerolineales bacterium]MBX3005296.1 GNAT family N-acetyltransferase [Anaerolineales bacterium]